MAAADWFSRKEASRYLRANGCHVTPRMLEIWAIAKNSGGGPVFYKDGTCRVQYRKDDLDQWREKRLVRVG